MTSPAAANPVVFDRSTEDVGNIVEFGHVNIRVPDQQKALIFYVMGLGLTRDPYLVTGVDNAWINVGTCQFHLPVGPAQVLRGVIGLVMPDIDALERRLAMVAGRLPGTRFGFQRAAQDMVEVSCPWGNRIRVHAPDVRRFGSTVLGMPYVRLDVAPGTAAGIAAFYREVLAAPALLGQDGGMPRVRVPIGAGEALEFAETQAPFVPYDGHHVQVAVADFSGVHRRLLARGLVTEESNQSQYRFQDIVDPSDGRVLATLEHEVRSMRHPLYARRLVNRNPAVTNQAYAPGHEDAMWRREPQ
jgi:catechol 2,3-dioxygenase-like lactoylglutathione lyase family enzyme